MMLLFFMSISVSSSQPSDIIILTERVMFFLNSLAMRFSSMHFGRVFKSFLQKQYFSLVLSLFLNQKSRILLFFFSIYYLSFCACSSLTFLYISILSFSFCYIAFVLIYSLSFKLFCSSTSSSSFFLRISSAYSFIFLSFYSICCFSIIYFLR